MAPFRVELVGKHDRSSFESGSPALDRYFREQVTQDIRRRLTSCYVAIGAESAVAGFYTLAATSLSLSGLNAEQARKLPRYPELPAILLGRLAVALAHQGKGLGAALVADAFLRSAQSQIAAYALVVDPKDREAASFYDGLGFARLKDSARMLKPLAGSFGR